MFADKRKVCTPGKPIRCTLHNVIVVEVDPGPVVEFPEPPTRATPILDIFNTARPTDQLGIFILPHRGLIAPGVWGEGHGGVLSLNPPPDGGPIGRQFYAVVGVRLYQPHPSRATVQVASATSVPAFLGFYSGDPYAPLDFTAILPVFDGPENVLVFGDLTTRGVPAFNVYRAENYYNYQFMLDEGDKWKYLGERALHTVELINKWLLVPVTSPTSLEIEASFGRRVRLKVLADAVEITDAKLVRVESSPALRAIVSVLLSAGKCVKGAKLSADGVSKTVDVCGGQQQVAERGPGGQEVAFRAPTTFELHQAKVELEVPLSGPNIVITVTPGAIKSRVVLSALSAKEGSPVEFLADGSRVVWRKGFVDEATAKRLARAEGRIRHVMSLFGASEQDEVCRPGYGCKTFSEVLQECSGKVTCESYNRLLRPSYVFIEYGYFGCGQTSDTSKLISGYSTCSYVADYSLFGTMESFIIEKFDVSWYWAVAQMDGRKRVYILYPPEEKVKDAVYGNVRALSLGELRQMLGDSNVQYGGRYIAGTLLYKYRSYRGDVLNGEAFPMLLAVIRDTNPPTNTINVAKREFTLDVSPTTGDYSLKDLERGFTLTLDSSMPYSLKIRVGLKLGDVEIPPTYVPINGQYEVKLPQGKAQAVLTAKGASSLGMPLTLYFSFEGVGEDGTVKTVERVWRFKP